MDMERGALTLGKEMQGAELRDTLVGPSPREAPAFLLVEENPQEEYGPWQWAVACGRATGRFGAEAFTSAAKMGNYVAPRGPTCG